MSNFDNDLLYNVIQLSAVICNVEKKCFSETAVGGNYSFRLRDIVAFLQYA